MPADADLVRGVRLALAGAADPERAAGMQAYMRSEMPFRGVAAPLLKSLVTPILATHVVTDRRGWQATVLKLWDDAVYREERYAALALARHRRYREFRSPRSMRLYGHLVRSGGWWDLVDEIATHLVREQVLDDQDRSRVGGVAEVVRAWADDENLWLRRSALVCQVGAGAQLDVDLLADVVDTNLDGSVRGSPALSRHGADFFIRKSIGWALRDAARTRPDWVREFVAVREDSLSGLSRREALRVVGS